jgi:hypothetical protein
MKTVRLGLCLLSMSCCLIFAPGPLLLTLPTPCPLFVPSCLCFLSCSCFILPLVLSWFCPGLALSCVVPFSVVLCCLFLSGYVSSYVVVSCVVYVVLCYVVSCFCCVALSYFVLCRIVVSWVILRCVVLCCLVVYSFVFVFCLCLCI